MKKTLFGDYTPTAEISLTNLKYNLEIIKGILCGNRFIAVVKSDAYGHGVEISSYINKYCDGFAVSRLDEAIKLRYLGITKPILMLVPLSFNEIKTAISYDIQIMCSSLEMLKNIKRLSNGNTVSINLKIDSNMNRLGFFDLNEFEKSLELISETKNIRPSGIYSHFSNCADFDCCACQFGIFVQFANLYSARFDGLRHMSASGGLIHKCFNLDAVRIGLLMYGYKPFDCDLNVKPIMRIVAEPILRKSFQSGERCMYNFEIESGDYALCNYGYADGLFRNSLPKRCMDLSFVKYDGKKAIIMDNAQKIADEFKTIPYEILTICAHRIKKIYVGDI